MLRRMLDDSEVIYDRSAAGPRVIDQIRRRRPESGPPRARRGSPLPAMACLRAQQCAEEHLEGYLVAHNLPFRPVHDLGYLINLCFSLTPAFVGIRSGTVIFNPSVATTRYPIEAAQELYTGAAREAIRLAQQTAGFVLQT